jgi:uncharacterized protein YcaQ
MYSVVKMNPSQARAVALRAQGLDGATTFGSGKAGTLNAIEHLGYVQIDTISVIERAHHHVLWSRLPDYAPERLRELHAERRVFEYWSHAAAFLPMRDFRQSLPLMRSFRRKFHWSDDSPELRRAMRRVLARIRSKGPLRARDFESNDVRVQGSWTFGKMEKRALHELWMRGDVMVASREGFQKSYDLTARVLPENVDRSMPTESEAADFLVERTLQAHSLAREPELRYLRDGAVAATIRKRLAHAVKHGRVVSLQVGDLEKPVYALPETLEHIPDGVEPTEARILSPFDNLIVQRERRLQLSTRILCARGEAPLRAFRFASALGRAICRALGSQGTARTLEVDGHRPLVRARLRKKSKVSKGLARGAGRFRSIQPLC